MSTNVSWESTNAASTPYVQTTLAPIIAHAAMVFKETGRRAKMLTNARKEATIAVSMLTAQTASWWHELSCSDKHSSMSEKRRFKPVNSYNCLIRWSKIFKQWQMASRSDIFRVRPAHFSSMKIPFNCCWNCHIFHWTNEITAKNLDFYTDLSMFKIVAYS